VQVSRMILSDGLASKAHILSLTERAQDAVVVKSRQSASANRKYSRVSSHELVHHGRVVPRKKMAVPTES